MATLRDILNEVNVEIVGPRTVHFNGKDYDVTKLPPATKKIVMSVIRWAGKNIKAFTARNLEHWDISTKGDGTVAVTDDRGKGYTFKAPA